MIAKEYITATMTLVSPESSRMGVGHKAVAWILAVVSVSLTVQLDWTHKDEAVRNSVSAQRHVVLEAAHFDEGRSVTRHLVYNKHASLVKRPSLPRGWVFSPHMQGVLPLTVVLLC